jgi:hypothetical protein
MMKRPVPPARLPREFADIWQALHQADAEAASRQALAVELGISTHTLQRILVRGDVPVLRGNENRRIVHAWTRTISRLARHFDRDPRAWLTRVGIPWSEEVARIVAAVARPRSLGPRVRKPRAFPDILRVAIVDRPPFSTPLEGGACSFLELLTRRWIGACDHKTQIRLQSMEERESMKAVEDGDVDILAGVCATAARMKGGIEFVPIPGFSVRLGGLRVGGSGDRGPNPTLADAIAHDILLVVEEGISHAFLAGACGIPAERIMLRGMHEAPALAEALIDATRREPGRVVLLDEEDVCRRVAICLRRIEGLPGEWEPVLLDAGSSVPSWPLSLAVRSEARSWRTILETAREWDLYGAAAEQTAALYAAFAAASDLIPRKPEASLPAFEQALARRLSGPAQVAPAGAGAKGPTPGKHCRSCSQSLDEEINRGVSEEYCRWCADERGRLRPRADVEKILSRWMKRWQGEMSDEEALRRTRLYMNAMPAWSRN